jgi:hypothetical protein
MLSELVKVLEERKFNLGKEVETINGKLVLLQAELDELRKNAHIKESQLAAINDQTIKEYKKVWKSYTPPNPFPCPLCFVFRKKLSPLEPMPRNEDVEPVTCKSCHETFEIPVELLYA